MTAESLLAQLETKTAEALKRIYTLEAPTPCHEITLNSGCKLQLKREDLSHVHSYKWRGAFNKISTLKETGFNGAIICASSGNHAQGVAISANRMKINATIFMPRSTPALKQQAVKNHGGDFVEIVLHGDSFDEAAQAAAKYAKESGGVIVPPYDDLEIIAGQSTIAVEILESLPSIPTHVFLAIGGGGMTAGVASVLKRKNPNIRIIGVEGVGQESMAKSVAAGKISTIKEMDKFCDGTAVATPGELTFELCKELVDEFIQIENDDVCRAIQFLWEEKRIIVEPSAALGVAAARKYKLSPQDRPLTITCGSNIDFSMLPQIAKQGSEQAPIQRYFRFELEERDGSLINLLDEFFNNINIIDFQYGKTDKKKAFPIIGIEVLREDTEKLNIFETPLRDIVHTEVSSSTLVDFRVIPFNTSELSFPFFAVITFPNRPGALREFMREASKLTSLCYMNYINTGHAEEQVLMGFEFASEQKQVTFLKWMESAKVRFKKVDEWSLLERS